MRRVVLVLAAFFVSLSLTGGAIAHAMEPIGCIDNSVAASMGHTNGDGDQVPFDGDKGYPHHHGVCHSHLVCNAMISSGVVVALNADCLDPIRAFLSVPAAPTDPALRPPIA